ncbi:MAG TPA: hypothetical protein VEA38_08835 [Terriglobales bacterium]|nr:hypothetical protein [Terriglobales bacterium]
MKPLLTRALDVLQGLTDACPQSGPGPRDFDVDHEALAAVRLDAEIVLYEGGRLVP